MCESGVQCPTHCPTPAVGFELTGVVWPLVGAVGAVGTGWVIVQHFSAASIIFAALAAVATVCIVLKGLSVALRSERRAAPAAPQPERSARVSVWASDLRQERKRQMHVAAKRPARPALPVVSARVLPEARPVVVPSITSLPIEAAR